MLHDCLIPHCTMKQTQVETKTTSFLPLASGSLPHRDCRTGTKDNGFELKRVPHALMHKEYRTWAASDPF